MNLHKTSFYSLSRLMVVAVFIGGFTGVAQAQRGGGGGAGGRGGGAVPTTPVNASFDTRTNTLIVTGGTDQIEQIERIIAEIDNNPTRDNQVFIYKVKNGSALNMEGVAQLVFTGTGGNLRGTQTSAQLQTNRNTLGTTGGGRGGGGRGGIGGFGGGGRGGVLGGVGGIGGLGGIAGGRGGTAFAAGQTNSVAGLIGQVTVVADPNTNTLLVTTHPDNWPEVKRILDDLDRSVPQVLIKVLVAEVTHDNSFDLGTELSLLNLRASGNGQQGGTDFNVPLPPNPLATGAIVQILETNFSAAIRALETAGKLDVLSRPYILASDNQLASIIVGQNVPYITESQITDEGAVNNSTDYATVGIILDVVPHINPDGLVNLDIAPEISSITNQTVQVSETLALPIFSTRSAQTRVSVQNGQTVVIGGLMEDKKDSQVNKVPILGDIPFIGNAFRSTSTNKTKTELLIFLTPHVAARPDMLQGMSDEEVGTTKLVPNAVEPGAFQQHQAGMNAGYRDVPITTQPAVLPHNEQQMTPPPPGGRGRGTIGPGGPGGRGRGRGPGSPSPEVQAPGTGQ